MTLVKNLVKEHSMGCCDCLIYYRDCIIFEVGLVLLIPIVFAISRELKVSILYLGISMAAALSVTHGFYHHTQTNCYRW